MEVLIRPYSRGTYPRSNTDAVSCTYNVDDFTPLSAVLIAYGIDRKEFASRAHMHEGGQFKVISHCDLSPIFITTSKTDTWDDAPQATRKIIEAANAVGCKSICLTHFMLLSGDFPKSAFNHCLHSAADSGGDGPMKQVIVDVDERHFEKAQILLDVVHTQQSYAQRHSLTQQRYVSGAEAGSPDYQGWLAAEILCRSTQDDRCIEALKWLALASLTRWNVDPGHPVDIHKSAFEFLSHGMTKQQVDNSFLLAQTWLEQKVDASSEYDELFPEFRRKIESFDI